MYDTRQNAIRPNQFHQDNWKSSKFDYEYLYLFICCLIVLYHLFHCHCYSALFSSSVLPLIYCLRQQPLILSKRRQTSEENICFPWHRIMLKLVGLTIKEFSYNILHMNNLFVRLNIRDWYFSRVPSSCWRRLVQSRRKCLKLVFLSRVATRFSKEDIFATINGCLFLTLKINQFLSFHFQLYKLCKSLELWGFKFGLLIDHSALPSIWKLYIPGNFG